VTIDSITKLSQLDAIMLASSSHQHSFKTLFLSSMLDISTDMFNLYLPYLSFFNSRYQDIYSMVSLLSPELILAFNDYFSTYFLSSSINFTPSAVFDSYSNNLNYSFSDGAVTFFMFFIYIWFLVYFVMTSSTLR
jgi:hypothetical protein